MKFIYLPYRRWDAMYDAIPEEVVVPVIVGGNILGCDFHGESEKVRVIRGLENQFGSLEARMIRGEFNPSEPSVLGTGVIPTIMAKELIAEGKTIPQRAAAIGIRRPAYSAVPIDMTASIPPSQMRHDCEPKPKKRTKKPKSRTRKPVQTRKR